MKTSFRIFALICFALFLSSSGFAKEAKYVGVKKCKSCHKKSKLGNAYKVWTDTKHSNAYKTLLTSAAKKEAKRAGIKESPEKAFECLVCHVTAPEAPKSKFSKSYKMKDGVSCESCHGPGSKYRKKKIMVKLRKEYLKGGNTLAKKYEYDHGSQSTCTDRCHRPEVTINGVTYKNRAFKKFDVKAAMKIIAHPLP